MKGNSKKLAIFVVIAVVATLLSVATAAARESIVGTYALTGSGACLIAINGLNASLQPNDGANGMWLSGPVTYDQGSITFSKDGTGIVQATFHTFDFWSPFFAGTPPDAGAANETWDFTYAVTKRGNLTITYTKGTFELDFTSGPNVGTPLGVAYATFPPVRGVISPDGKNLTVSYGAPGVFTFTADKANNVPTPTQAACNVVLQGFLVGPGESF